MGHNILPNLPQKRREFDMHRAVGIIIIIFAGSLLLGEFVVRPLLFPAKPAAPVDTDIKLQPDTPEPEKRIGPGPRCC